MHIRPPQESPCLLRLQRGNSPLRLQHFPRTAIDFPANVKHQFWLYRHGVTPGFALIAPLRSFRSLQDSCGMDFSLFPNTRAWLNPRSINKSRPEKTIGPSGTERFPWAMQPRSPNPPPRERERVRTRTTRVRRVRRYSHTAPCPSERSAPARNCFSNS